MQVAQILHLVAIGTGVVSALYLRAFVLVFLTPLICIAAFACVWLSGYPPLTATMSAGIDFLLLQLSYFIGLVVLSRVSIRRPQPHLERTDSAIDRKKISLFNW